jgi:hypothetical protein
MAANLVREGVLHERAAANVQRQRGGRAVAIGPLRVPEEDLIVHCGRVGSGFRDELATAALARRRIEGGQYGDGQEQKSSHHESSEMLKGMPLPRRC